MKKSKKSADYAPGSMGRHEALHMAQFLESAIDNELVQHPAILKHEKWLKLAVRAADALAELHQAIGKKHLR